MNIMTSNLKFKIASWNLCLGLINKKDYVSEIMTRNKIDICCIQEAKILPGFDHTLLSTGEYSLIIENNEYKARTGMYIRNGTSFTRRENLEGKNSGIMVVDINLTHKYRLINVYRSFNPPGTETQKEIDPPHGLFLP